MTLIRWRQVRLTAKEFIARHRISMTLSYPRWIFFSSRVSMRFGTIKTMITSKIKKLALLHRKKNIVSLSYHLHPMELTMPMIISVKKYQKITWGRIRPLRKSLGPFMSVTMRNVGIARPAIIREKRSLLFPILLSLKNSKSCWRKKYSGKKQRQAIGWLTH